MPALSSQWENSHQQRDTATAKRSPTRPPPMVVVGATGSTLAVLSLMGKLSVPHAAMNTASCCDTPTCLCVRELSNRASTARLRSVHTLRVGQHFDVPGVGTDERSRNRFRSGLYAAARLDKVSVRGLPDGSVRVTRVGEWSSVRVNG